MKVLNIHVTNVTMRIKIIHEGFRHKCDQCEQQFTVISSLKAHKASKHDGVKYKCDFCDMQVVRKSSLKHHILLKHSRQT